MIGTQLQPIKTGVQRAAIYARVSLKSEALLHSVAAQIDAYTRLLQESPGWALAGVYADVGISGTGMKNRPELNRLLADCEKGLIDVILVKSVSRFARNTLDLLVMVRRLNALGGSVWFEEQNMQSLTQEGELMLTLISSIAQAESFSISENSKWAIRKNFAEGIENTHRRTFGYRWQGGSLVPIPAEAAAVRRIFAGFLAGESRAATARVLQKAGVKALNGGSMGTSSISYILQNVTYTGVLLLQKTYTQDPISKRKCKNRGELPQYLVQGHHKAIIEPGVFARVQARLEQNRHEKKFPYNRTGQRYVFSGKILCACCGRHYTRQLWKNGSTQRPTWTCTGKKAAKNRCTKSKNLSEKLLLNACCAAMQTEHFDQEKFEQNIEQIIAHEAGQLEFCFRGGRRVQISAQKAEKQGFLSP